MTQEIRRLRPGARVSALPLADGGDGTLEVLLKAWQGRRMSTWVRGPLGKSTRAEWGIAETASRRVAVIEMAQASGLALLRGKNKILEATSYGTGELIRAALEEKCRRIIIGVGGTATSDGGAGALAALGFRYLDGRGRALSPRPVHLVHMKSVDGARLDPRLKETRIIVACDVRNPLLGPRGSAQVFGPQKGASPQEVEFLEKFLAHWASFAKVKTKNRSGTGAAGGVAFGLSAFAGAELAEGAPFVMDAVKWPSLAKRAALILTGEGRLDATSFSGKVIGEIVRRRGRAAVYAICGEARLSRAALKRRGISKVEEMGLEGIRNPILSLAKATARLML